MADAPVVGVTIAGALTSAAVALAPSSPSARLDAEVLMAHVLGVDRSRLIIDSQAQLDGLIHERFDRLTRRRMLGEPVAYLTGRRGFRALELAVDPGVLIPRPETETLVEIAIAEIAPRATVLDVGTGSGAIALALAHERPDLRISAVDVSGAALAVAAANASRLNLDVSFSQSDLLNGASEADAVVANLPYVERDAPLPVDVAGFEPHLALYGGADGLTLIRRLATQLAAHAWPSWVGLEIGVSQGGAVATMLRAAGFVRVDVRRDLSGHDRVVVGRRGARPTAAGQPGESTASVGESGGVSATIAGVPGEGAQR